MNLSTMLLFVKVIPEIGNYKLEKSVEYSIQIKL